MSVKKYDLLPIHIPQRKDQKALMCLLQREFSTLGIRIMKNRACYLFCPVSHRGITMVQLQRYYYGVRNSNIEDARTFCWLQCSLHFRLPLMQE
jgi:hypothetical protein